PHQFATALFSFLYHLASYDAGGEALVSCGMMEALLKVIKFLGDEQDQITFVTRAVRVVDLITNLDMAAFQAHSGLSIFIYRLEHEVDLCRRECPFVIKPKVQRRAPPRPPRPCPAPAPAPAPPPPPHAAVGDPPGGLWGGHGWCPRDTTGVSPPSLCPPGGQCIPQRAALLKSMLNWGVTAPPDPPFWVCPPPVMDGSLPTSLKHIISNAEYYGPSLFLLAVLCLWPCPRCALTCGPDPSSGPSHSSAPSPALSLSLPCPLSSLPNVFSALCLNARGLQSFVQCQPFERLFKVLLSPDYLPAMRRRRSSDPLGE
ncbi:HUWE1 ligase, partial [Serilophus lunatus]|nr:HUWE1 ligase [Serilophus lunatus]